MEYIVESDFECSDELHHAKERIVRCRDCKFAGALEGSTTMLDCMGRLATTWDYYNDEPQENPVEPDGFCAWGERRMVE